jgi:hypothetical protein
MPRPLRSHRADTTQPNALDAARAAFSKVVLEPSAPRLDGRQIDGLPDEPISPPRLAQLLLDRACPQSTRDDAWRTIVTRARADERWSLCAVGLALPALTSVVARLTRASDAEDTADIAAEVLIGFLAALHIVELDRPRIMLRLRWSAYRAGLAELRRARHRAVPLERDAAAAATSGHPDLVLATAVRERVITRLGAQVIGATRLDGETVSAWAQEHGLSPWAAYKVRQRAEQRLITWLTGAERHELRARHRSTRSATAPGSESTTSNVQRRGA